MHPVELSSVLAAEYRFQLEQLLYFNRLQSRAAPAIAGLVEKYGQPWIQQIDGRIRVRIGEVPGVQALFALSTDHRRRLAGVVVYTREGADLVIIHIAVARTFSYCGAHRHAFVVMRMVEAIRDVARRLNGVHGVVLYYPAGVPQRLTVKPWRQATVASRPSAGVGWAVSA
jgi:hypothetical protein